MPGWMVFKHWPLRAKLMALLLAASLLPLGFGAAISVRNARLDEFSASAALLAARADELVGRIDTLNQAYQQSVRRLARGAGAIDFLEASDRVTPERRLSSEVLLRLWPASDGNIRGVALLDAKGRVTLATEPVLMSRTLDVSFLRAALAGAEIVSDVFVAEPALGGRPTIGYAAPVRSADQHLLGVAVLWVEAAPLRNLLRAADGVFGPGSMAVLFDGYGIRIGQSGGDQLLFTPGITLPAPQLEKLVAEQRFGSRTRELLQSPRRVAGPFGLGNAAVDAKPFRGFVPEDGRWHQVVARQCQTVGWTVYYMRPEALLNASIARMVRSKLIFAGIIGLAVVVLGAVCGALVLQPLGRLTVAARELGAGKMSTRVQIDQRDELGGLGAAFNSMAERIQEQSAALVRESQEQYRSLFQMMSEGFCTVDVIFDEQGNAVDFRYVEVNRAFEVQAGFRPVPGQSMREQQSDLDEYWIQLIGGVARTGTPVAVEAESHGLGRHFFVSAYRVDGAHGSRVAMLFKDITERKAAQRRLQVQIQHLDLLRHVTRAIGERQDLPSIFQVTLRAIEDSLSLDFCCALLLDVKARQLVVSQVGGCGRMLMNPPVGSVIALAGSGLESCARGSVLHEPPLRSDDGGFVSRLAAAGLHDVLATPLLVQSQVFGVLVVARRAAGSLTSAECEFLRQLSEHVALAAHQAQLFGALQSAYENLQRTQQSVMQHERLRALGQMASGIAHDINNAISPVALYADSLLEREHSLSEQGRQQLLTVQRAVHDVAETVARMREFYRPQSPQSLSQPLQLNELVPQVLELTRAHWNLEAEQHGVVIDARAELAPDLPLIAGSSSEIREALTNLILNAVDAMPEGGTLTVRTAAAPGDGVVIEVIDTGIGMDEDSRRRCLEPFYTTKGERGTGLGLAMVYGISQRHGALLEIDSHPGRGTTVRLRFSAVRPESRS